MRETVTLTGMVLKASPAGERDKRLVLLTRERGKITAFARGVRRPGSSLMAVSSPFVFGHFELFEGREVYNLHAADVTNYFQELMMDVEGACYGSYFMELADYYGREAIESTEMVYLLYQSLRALQKPSLPDELVQRIFELRMMVINGEYTEHPPFSVCDSAHYAWEFIIATPLESLYTFLLTEEAFSDLSRCVEENKRRYIDREFHSLDILRALGIEKTGK